ncbi:MAG: hypothetical protein JO256_00605 [Alphaproteobacteria bacterium]|nr:hypothetical protein [Alphaproteobacteria bacterium]
MPHLLRRAGAFAALTALAASAAEAAPTRCANAAEVSAIQVSAVQQELTDAALACGPGAVANFNRFQTVFQKELRRSDALLLAMFKRLNGVSAGNAAYDAYKTRAIAHAEQRRTKPGAHDSFCAAAQIVFEAALAPDKPVLEDFVSGVPVFEQNPVDACEINVTLTLQGVQAGAAIAPTPRPRLASDPADDSGLFPR